jgi:organic anion transporter 3A
MYSMVAFGLVVGFLLGGYFITMHENSFGSGVVPPDLYNGHPRWIGAWWGGFVLLGVLLILIAIPFFTFPRTLRRDRLRKQHTEVTALRSNRIQLPAGQTLCIKCRQGADGQLHLNITGRPKADSSSVDGIQVNSIQVDPLDSVVPSNTAIVSLSEQPSSSSSATDKSRRKLSIGQIELSTDQGVSCASESERKLSNIPASMYKLLSNPIYIVTCLGSCMELCIVSGFLVFLPKYLETQFTIGKSQANLFAGGIAVPGACFGIFLGGYLLKKLQLKPKDAIQFVLFFNLVCMGLYTALYFLGCDNMKMAGATHPYSNR